MTTLNQYKLSIMMFLQFFVWGTWFVTLGTFLIHNLHAKGLDISMAFATQSIGAIVAPFIVGLIADRFFHAQRILAILHLVGAVMLYKMYTSDSFSEFYPYVFFYMIAFMPTLSLVNSVSFRQMDDPGKQFSSVRVWGTIGWIVSGLVISYLFHWDSVDNVNSGLLKNTFLVSCSASFILAIFSLFLPRTPPLKTVEDKAGLIKVLGLDAIKLLKDQNFLVFFVSSVCICVPLAFYYQVANPFFSTIGMENPTGKMTIGQGSEVFFLLLLPVFFKRFGLKWTLLIGMLAWVIRYFLFAFGDAGVHSWMLIGGIALHGVCYDFFFVAGQIYTDAKADDHIKNSAQGLIAFATYGIGMLLGYWLAGVVTDRYGNDWTIIWVIPAGIAMLVMVVFSLTFKETGRYRRTLSPRQKE